MDRLSKVHRNFRVELPTSIVNFENADANTNKAPRSLPIVPRYVGIIGFMTCGAVVIATASFLALSIQ